VTLDQGERLICQHFARNAQFSCQIGNGNRRTAGHILEHCVPRSCSDSFTWKGDAIAQNSLS
jgi:hypothetical protein